MVMKLGSGISPTIVSVMKIVGICRRDKGIVPFYHALDDFLDDLGGHDANHVILAKELCNFYALFA